MYYRRTFTHVDGRVTSASNPSGVQNAWLRLVDLSRTTSRNNKCSWYPLRIYSAVPAVSSCFSPARRLSPARPFFRKRKKTMPYIVYDNALLQVNLLMVTLSWTISLLNSIKKRTHLYLLLLFSMFLLRFQNTCFKKPDIELTRGALAIFCFTQKSRRSWGAVTFYLVFNSPIFPRLVIAPKTNCRFAEGLFSHLRFASLQFDPQFQETQT